MYGGLLSDLFCRAGLLAFKHMFDLQVFDSHEGV